MILDKVSGPCQFLTRVRLFNTGNILIIVFMGESLQIHDFTICHAFGVKLFVSCFMSLSLSLQKFPPYGESMDVFLPVLFNNTKNLVHYYSKLFIHIDCCRIVIFFTILIF